MSLVYQESIVARSSYVRDKGIDVVRLGKGKERRNFETWT